MIKRLIAFVLLFVLAFGLSCCDKTPQISESSSSIPIAQSQSSITESEQEYDPANQTIAICLWFPAEPLQRMVQLGFVEKAQELGYRNIIISSVADTSDLSIEMLSEKWSADIVTHHVAGTVVWTGDDSFYELFKDWTEDGIKIVVPFFAHSYIDTKDFISANPARNLEGMGTIAADALVDILSQKGIYHGGIGVAQAFSGVEEHPENDAFRLRIAQLGTEFEIYDTTQENHDLLESITLAEKYIEKNPDLVGVFSCSSGSGVWWSEAKKNMSRQDLSIVGMYQTSDNLQLLKSSDINAIIAQPFYECGAEAAQMLDASLRGKVYDENEWQPMLDGYIVTADGEGKNGAQYHLDMLAKIAEFDWDKYMA